MPAAPSRQASSGRSLDGIQLLRAIACLAVVFHHSARKVLDELGVEPAVSLLGIGNRGVELFFVLSGFIIFYAHAADPGGRAGLVRYGWKRLTRIVPVTFIVATVWMALLLAAGQLDGPWPWRLRVWLSSALVLPMLEWPNPIVIWTLKHELLFYGVFALSYWSRRLALAALVLWVFAALAYDPRGANLALMTVFSNMNALFVAGAGAWWIHARGLVPRVGVKVGLASLAGFLGVATLAKHASSHTSLVVLPFGLLAAAAIVGFARAPRRDGRWSAIALTLGDASFSIYLVHYPVVSLCSKVLARVAPQPEVMYLGSALAGTLAGLAFWAACEKPLLKLLQRAAPSGPGAAYAIVR